MKISRYLSLAFLFVFTLAGCNPNPPSGDGLRFLDDGLPLVVLHPVKDVAVAGDRVAFFVSKENAELLRFFVSEHYRISGSHAVVDLYLNDTLIQEDLIVVPSPNRDWSVIEIRKTDEVLEALRAEDVYP